MRSLTIAAAAAGVATFLWAAQASRTGVGASPAGIALYAVAGACFLLASFLYRKRDGG